MFPPVLIHLTANGEASGQLAPMLERAAVELEREAAAADHLVRGAAAAGADRDDGRDRAGAGAGGDAADRLDEPADSLIRVERLQNGRHAPTCTGSKHRVGPDLFPVPRERPGDVLAHERPTGRRRVRRARRRPLGRAARCRARPRGCATSARSRSGGSRCPRGGRRTRPRSTRRARRDRRRRARRARRSPARSASCANRFHGQASWQSSQP